MFSLEHAEALWNEWEIHVLILASFGLQVFLFLTAGMRRCSASAVLRSLLWLAYLSADSVAVFVLGHLAMRGGDPQHELVLFWAPFVLVHLGGQDTITAFSMQDNELWMRHLLGLVSQVAVAVYVVSRSSWPDTRLRAAMVLVFLSGCIKYAGRTVCLYKASPGNLRVGSLETLLRQLERLQQWKQAEHHPNPDPEERRTDPAEERFRNRLELMFKGDVGSRRMDDHIDDDDDIAIMSVDTPLNDVHSVANAGLVAGLLARFKGGGDRCRAYDYVGAQLVHYYQTLYTKSPLLSFFNQALRKPKEFCLIFSCLLAGSILWCLPIAICCGILPFLFYLIVLFHYVSTPITLVLFALAEKQAVSRADITVSYILLVGAIILDVPSVFTFIASRVGRDTALRRTKRWFALPWTKQWSGMLAQYNMVTVYSRPDTTRSTWQTLQRWIGKRLNSWGVGLLDPSITHTPLTEDVRKIVLDKLLELGTGGEEGWNFASFRGQWALRRLVVPDQPTEPTSENADSQSSHIDHSTTALHKSIDRVDFPTSVLIWHIATNMCYYCGNTEEGSSSTNTSTVSSCQDQVDQKKALLKELSNYIMYLVFKCDVMLTSNSRAVHHHALYEMKNYIFPGHANLGEEDAVKMVFQHYKERQPANMDYAIATSTRWQPASHLQLLQSTAKALSSDVLPRAYGVAKELINIHNEAARWDLIAAVWLEMLFYTAPRCGGAFHYHHLATGGEFITHVLLLMRSLGPFLPPPDGLQR